METQTLIDQKVVQLVKEQHQKAKENSGRQRYEAA